MTITARYASHCATCHKAICVGEKIEWTKGAPARHASCPAPSADAATDRMVADYVAREYSWTTRYPRRSTRPSSSDYETAEESGIEIVHVAR